MKYIDRKGNIMNEETGQDRLLARLYNDHAGRLAVRALVRPWLTRAAGVFLSSSLSRHLIPGFLKNNSIDMTEYEQTEYHSYNDFFTRRILPDRRPVYPGENVLVSPCDGKLSVSRIDADSRFFVKGRSYTAEEFLRSSSLARKFRGGYAIVLRLTVDNYHRYCYPAGGMKSDQVYQKGVYHTVNPAANEAVPVYTENTREYCLIRTEDLGTILMAEVGAMIVGRITNYLPCAALVKKGDEKGRFEFGGSTIVLLVQNGRVRIDEDLLYHTENGYETIVKMGEKIGKSCKLPKRTGPADR